MAPRKGPIVIEREPFNASTPPSELLREVTPTEVFFVRNHFPAPEIDPTAWRLTIDGGTRRDPYVLDLDALKRFPARDITATFECAGNGRSRLQPAVSGVQWDDTAVGTARWRGARLADVLDEAGRPKEAVELLFAGADEGEEGGRRMAFERSLPDAQTRRDDVLLAYEMNGEPLTRDHGAPVRLIVPGWYGVASVKWLTRIRFLDHAFDGWFQRDRYVYRDGDGTVQGPVAWMRPKSLIIAPQEAAEVHVGGRTEIAGVAWSGESPLERVEVSTDGGTTWAPAELEAGPPNAARRFRAAWTPDREGFHEIRARAVAVDGRRQPESAEWNAHGYGVNVVVPRRVRATRKP